MEDVDTINNNELNYSTLLLNKYFPKKMSDIVGNKGGINTIASWVNTFEEIKKNFVVKNDTDKKKKRILKKSTDQEEETEIEEIEDDVVEEHINDDVFSSKKIIKKQGPFSCLLITGPHGVGKTCSVITYLTEKKYLIKTINFQKLKNGKSVNELLQNIQMRKTDVYTQLYGNVNNKTAIIVDNLESITTTSEKACIKQLIKINETQWLFPLIFITNTQHSKFINEIDKKAQSVRFWNPFLNEIKPFVINICKSEGINIMDYKCYDKIISYSQTDIRKILYLLQDMKTSFCDKNIYMKELVNYLDMFKKKDIDMTLLTSTRKLLQEYSGISDILKQHEIEKVTLPLMIHQNYLDYVEQLCNDERTQHELTSEISEYLSRADVIENYMYGYQIWSIYEVQGMYGCVIPSYLINKYTENPFDIKMNITYTKDPNKTSIKKINKKNKLNINKVLKNLDINDCVYISQIIKDLIERDKIDECRKLLSGYNLTLANIDTLLKIDKTKTSKNTLDTTIKNKLIQIINGDSVQTGPKKRRHKVKQEPKTMTDTSNKTLEKKNENSIKTKRIGKKIIKYK
jgi:hypothetical protein